VLPSRSPGSVGAVPGPAPLVGPMRAGYGACIGVRLPTGFYVWDDSGHVSPGFPKPGVAGVFAELADLDGDGATEIAAGTAPADSMVYAFDAGAATWNESLAYWPTARGDDARTGARGYPVGLPLYDRIRPAPPVLVAEALSSTLLRVRWVNTGDDSLTGDALVANVNGSTPPGAFPSFTHGVIPAHAPGTADTVYVPASEGQLWEFSAWVTDEAGNASIVVTDTVLTPGAAPGAISDLHVAAAHDSTVKLVWTAPTDDGPAGRPVSYEIAGSTATLDSSNFAAAPVQRQLVATSPAGAPESLTVTGLERGRRWTFAVRGVDATNARSALSNPASVMLRTGGAIEGHGGRAIAARPVPGVPPITLDWQGADGAIGTAQQLDLLDLGGRLLRRVELGGQPGGSWQWDGRDADGRAVPAGLYFARLASGGGHSEARVVLLR